MLKISPKFPAFLFGVVALALVFGVLRSVKNIHAQAAGGFTSTLQEVSTGTDGRQTFGPTYTFATRSDGSTAAILTPSVRVPEIRQRVLFLAAGTRAQIIDARRLKSTIHIADKLNPAKTARRYASSDCSIPGDVELVKEKVSGYSAVALRRGPVTTWYALDGACAIVNERVTFANGAFSEKHLVSLQLGEPQPSLFSIPDSFAEAPPSKLAEQFPNYKRSATMDGADADYYQRHL